MNSLDVDDLAALADRVDEVIGGLVRVGLETLSDAEAVRVLTLGGRLLRTVEALLIEDVGEVASRSDRGDREARLTSRFGCHDVSELIQRTTLVSAQYASRMQRAARAVDRETSIVAGEKLPAKLPAMREALLGGKVGVDGVLAVAGALSDLDRRIGRDAILAADVALAATARGEGPDAAPLASADMLRLHATAWATALDQDGSQPREREALHGRSISLGTPRNGLVPIRGGLLPEVAAQLQRIFDALTLPRGHDDTGGVRFRPQADSDGDGDGDGADFIPPDERRPQQRRHDALATALFAAAASATLPTIGGAAPTLVVAVRESDLLNGGGWAHADSCDEPLPIGAAHRVGCAGAVQRIMLNDEGRIVQIGTEQRVFNRHQRRAIALRDGGCLIPGCGVPAAWCEIHHVDEFARGGKTHTDNGVMLCWFHHRFFEWHQWRIRMNRGVPEVQTPPWNDTSGRWRPVTKSRIRLAELLVQRT